MRSQPGASCKVVLLGGSHGSVALARTLKRAGMQVWLFAQQRTCAAFSNAIAGHVLWRGPGEPQSLDALESIAHRHGLAGSVLIAAGDAEVHLVARAHPRLSSLFNVLTTPWERLQWACDKARAYERAAALGIDVPRRFEVARMSDSDMQMLPFPLVLKPRMRLVQNCFTLARAWRVNDAHELRQRLREAAQVVDPEDIIVQQLIPGGGESQLSYAGVWCGGEPVIHLTARRLRQYPAEFAHTSTHVESADLPEVVRAAEMFLRSIGHHGLVEIEFKRDERDGAVKLLDVNPRPWNWLSLAGAAGVDIGAAIAAIVAGRPLAAAAARAGIAWNFASRDLAAAAATGKLRPAALLPYASTFLRVRSWACFSWTDPLPSIADIPITMLQVLKHRRHLAPIPHASDAAT